MFQHRPYQEKIHEKATQAILDGVPSVLIDSATGCLTGDAVVSMNLGGKGKSMTLLQAYRGYNGIQDDTYGLCKCGCGEATFVPHKHDKSKGWVPGVPLKYRHGHRSIGSKKWSATVSVRAFRGEEGVGLQPVLGVVQSGMKPVFELLLESGKRLEGTACHPILTVGGWVKLGDLSPVHQVMTNDPNAKSGGKAPKKHYPYSGVSCLRNHPFAREHADKRRGTVGHRVPQHVLSYEANANGMTMGVFLSRLDSGDISGMTFVDPSTHVVHHADGDHNNVPRNLQKLTPSEHGKVHGGDSAFNFGNRGVTPDRVVSVKFVGVKMTYDIQCQQPFHNFIANGIVVHNSGKTCIGLRLAKWCVDNADRIGMAGKKVCVLWVAHRGVLLAQVLTENGELGIHCPNLIPFSMFTTISTIREMMGEWDEFIVCIDEVQHVACSSCATLLNVLNPRVTIGLSATPFRADRHELCFGKTIKESSYFALVRDGWLSQFDYYSISGGWTPASVAASYLRDEQRWGKSLMFFLSRQECRDCCDILQRAGVAAEVIDGTMGVLQRNDIVDRFECGKIKVLVNAMLLTEGFNDVSIKTAFVRDSGNKGPTTQMGGRVLRICKKTGIKQVVQSVSTKYPFTKVANARHQFMEEGGAWLDVGESEEAHKQAISIGKKLAHAKTTVPKYIQYGGAKYVALAERSEAEQEKLADRIEGGLL